MSRLRKWDERRLCHEEAQRTITNVFDVYRAINKSCDRVFAYNPERLEHWAAALSTSNSFLQTP